MVWPIHPNTSDTTPVRFARLKDQILNISSAMVYTPLEFGAVWGTCRLPDQPVLAVENR
jgi:hypothetical protein